MAYKSGTSATLAALLADIKTACTDNGWTLSGDVLHKGSVYQRLTISGNFIDSLGGTGIDGSNNLTGQPPANSNSRIGSLTLGPAPFVFPLNWEVFVGTVPDEVYVVVNYSSDKYQWLAWGKSSITTSGTGAWYSGSWDNITGIVGGISLVVTTVFGGNGSRGLSYPTACPGLFHAASYVGSCGERVNHGIGTTTNGWSVETSGPTSAKYRAPLDAILPSAWNTQAVLLPIQALSDAYGSSKVAMVVDVAHARALRIDNHMPGDIITLGADRWKVFPWYHKSAAESSSSTGRIGWAIRYDGP